MTEMLIEDLVLIISVSQGLDTLLEEFLKTQMLEHIRNKMSQL